VCAADPFCCDVAWDDKCAADAASLCGDLCLAEICTHAPVSCNDNNVCTDDHCDPAVGCANTPIDCDDNNACTQDSCGPSDCCEIHGTPGCNDSGCEAVVCAADPFCCDVEWDGTCAAEAASLCDDLCLAGFCTHVLVSCDDNNACTEDSCGPSCCVGHDTPGCDDPGCQQIVCAADPFCCNMAWDDICAAEAANLCGDLCLAASCTHAPLGCDCGTGVDCADQDNDGIRDDACTWYGCSGGACVTMARSTQADIGGFSGACPIDSACDGNDRFHALNCFSNGSTLGTPPYPCEPDAPFALNTDAGGPATCQLDGVCDGNDAFHALNCFENDWFDGSLGYQCACGPQPVHESGPPPRLQQAGLMLAAPDAVHAGAKFDVDVFLADEVEALRGYQLHLGAHGGKSGRLELVDIAIREPNAFLTGRAGLKPMRAGSGPASTNPAGAWSAFNLRTQQMLAGLDDPEGVPAAAGAYLATFTYRVAAEAAGTFTIEVLYDDAGGWTPGGAPRAVPQERTFLFGRYGGLIDVTEAPPVSVTITPASRARTARAARP
jgi:hypothetical protein